MHFCSIINWLHRFSHRQLRGLGLVPLQVPGAAGGPGAAQRGLCSCIERCAYEVGEGVD